MNWFIGILISIIVLNVVYGVLRGWKEQSFKTLSTVIALVVSIGLAILLQLWANNFQLLDNLGSIFHPDIIASIKSSITFLLPNEALVLTLNNILLLKSYSALVMVIIYLIVKKLVSLLFTLIFKLSRAEKLIRKGREKQKLSYYLVGGLVGLLNGILMIVVVYSPIVELLAAL